MNLMFNFDEAAFIDFLDVVFGVGEGK